MIHPFEGGYVNEIIRFLIPEHIEKFFYLEYWGSVYRQGFEWLNQNAEPGSQICFRIGHIARHYPKRKDLILKCDENNSYVATVPRYDPGFNYPVVFKVSIYKNSDLLYIYKIK